MRASRLRSVRQARSPTDRSPAPPAGSSSTPLAHVRSRYVSRMMLISGLECEHPQPRSPTPACQHASTPVTAAPAAPHRARTFTVWECCWCCGAGRGVKTGLSGTPGSRPARSRGGRAVSAPQADVRTPFVHVGSLQTTSVPYAAAGRT